MHHPPTRTSSAASRQIVGRRKNAHAMRRAGKIFQLDPAATHQCGMTADVNIIAELDLAGRREQAKGSMRTWFPSTKPSGLMITTETWTRTLSRHSGSEDRKSTRLNSSH